jgi:CubicO group peptidase (beta-lactamase class C family)
MRVLERKVEKLLSESISGVTPGVQVQVHQAGRKVIDISVGETFVYYDLASVTKIIFTTQILMRAFELGKWNMESTVREFLPWFPHPDIKIASCLNHSSGLVWWRPFYENLMGVSSPAARWKLLETEITKLPLELKEASTYSDVGFLTLGFVLENMYQRPLVEIWNMLKEEFFSATTLEFHPDNQPKYERHLYAPTEERGWRGKVIQGEVNDDNTWALGGVAPHAGLFGSIDDLGWYALHLRSLIHGVNKSAIKQKTAQIFVARSRPEGLGDWALGYMMPAKEGSMVGKYFSSHSIGHWGFTGTSVWYDPVYDLSVVVVSNRTWLGRENKKFNELRPKLHNWIVEGMRRV